jgi:hypothetical protein
MISLASSSLRPHRPESGSRVTFVAANRTVKTPVATQGLGHKADHDYTGATPGEKEK